MKELLKVDICVIGAGSGGLSVAAAAVQMGATVALIEKEKMGGDCLNYGCVPSKSLLAAAKVANTFRKANLFGLKQIEPQVEIAKVMKHVDAVINAIEPKDSKERFEGLGVHVFLGEGHFVDKSTVSVNDQIIKAKYFVIATGSSAAIPPIEGLSEVAYYTNETIFKLDENPSHLIIIGGGPIGCELGQAFLLLGIKVTVIESKEILPHDEHDLVNVLRQQLLSQGLTLIENAKVLSVNKEKDAIEVTIEKDNAKNIIEGSHLLVATGRMPNVANLNLKAAEVDYSEKGVKVDARLRTSNSHIYAIGDVTHGYQFTHVANYHAGIAIRNMLFKLPAKVDYKSLPWVTYTYPELAHVGLLSSKALEEDPNVKILSFGFAENDRAQTEHETVGQIKIITTARGKILGASILGANAGELLLPWVIAIQNKQNISTLANVIVPYPTMSEITKQVASEYYKPIFFSSFIKKVVKFLRFI